MDSYLEDALMENTQHFFVFPEELETMPMDIDPTLYQVDIDLLPSYILAHTPAPPPLLYPNQPLSGIVKSEPAPLLAVPNPRPAPLSDQDAKLSVTYGKILAKLEGLDVVQMRALYRMSGRNGVIHQRIDQAIVAMNALLKDTMGNGPNGEKGLRRHIALAILYVFFDNPTMTSYRTTKGRVSRVLLMREGKVRRQGPWGSSPKGSGRIKKQ